MTTALVFPGQGAHRAGMASAFAGHPAASTFDEVGRIVGMPELAALADDREACRSTVVAQPAVFAAGIAAWRALGEPQPVAVAGHSLGECTAAVVAGVVSLTDGARLVGERGHAFADACRRRPGAMAAVLGLDLAEATAAIDGIADVRIANDNAPGQVVLAGPPRAVATAVEACRDAGGRVRMLDVEGAFHTPAMASAVVRVATMLRRLTLHDARVPVVAGATGEPALSADLVARNLVDGVLAPVRWRQVQHTLVALGATEVVECGPGDVLRGLARRTIPEVAA